MPPIASSLTDLIGGTPLLRLQGFEKKNNLSGALIAKLEYFNPAGSVKDRAALSMILDAEGKGLLRPGSVIIEPTSGNTGIALAAVAAARGYRVILTMPETMSAERRALLRAYGAELVLTEGALGMKGAIDQAKAIAAETPGSFIPGQFENPANAAAHYASTGPEIWRDLEGNIAAFVAGVGTGGTITGVGAYLKKKNSNLHVVAVEPHDSPVLSGGKAGAHKIQGIGAGFVPAALDVALLDEIITVKSADAIETARALVKTDGLLVGFSSGAAVLAASVLAARPQFFGENIVVLLPDSGERYLSEF